MCFSLQIDLDLKKLAKAFKAEVAQTEFEKFHHLRTLYPTKFKRPNENNQIYPNYFCPIIFKPNPNNDQSMIWPMRYRIRPHDSNAEIPSKFNVFNARLDSLELRSTWKNLFGKKHCLIPLYKFYEWVDYTGSKKLISFFPENNELLIAPGLYDVWYDKEHDFHMHSFAIITTDPPEEIKEMKHDRCPVILKEQFYNEWLSPNTLSVPQARKLLKETRPITFSHHFLN